jgi:HAD superfamily hydrolase (TIGR01490 family)
MDRTRGENAVAAFDFDGTLTSKGTVLPFVTYVVGRRRLLANAPFLLDLAARHRLGALEARAAKERLFERFFAGMDARVVRARAEAFSVERVPRWLRPRALERLRWHRARGHLCVLVTASLEPCVLPWAKTAGFSHVLASDLEIDGRGRVTGRISTHCDGDEKLRRLRALVVPARGEDFTLYAYGDGRGDHALLAGARYAYFRTFPSEDAS